MYLLCHIKQRENMKNAGILLDNEYYRVNSYYWQGIVYIALDVLDGKTLCQIKGSKSKPKWIKTEQLSKTMVNFKTIN